MPLGRRAAHLVGLQAFDETARLVGPLDPDAAGFLRYLEAMNRGTGHRVLDVDEGGGRLWVEDIRVDGDADSLEIWNGLWTGAAAVHDPALRVTSEPGGEWRVTRG